MHWAFLCAAPEEGDPTLFSLRRDLLVCAVQRREGALPSAPDTAYDTGQRRPSEHFWKVALGPVAGKRGAASRFQEKSGSHVLCT